MSIAIFWSLVFYLIGFGQCTSSPSTSPTMEPTVQTSQPTGTPTVPRPVWFIRQGYQFDTPYFVDCTNGCEFDLYVRSHSAQIVLSIPYKLIDYYMLLSVYSYRYTESVSVSVLFGIYMYLCVNLYKIILI